MTIGAALFLIAVGWILRYAVVDRVETLNLAAIGTIFIWIGVIGLIVGLVMMALDSARGRRGRRTVDDRW